MSTICVQPKMLKSSEISGVVCMDEGQKWCVWLRQAAKATKEEQHVCVVGE